MAKDKRIKKSLLKNLTKEQADAVFKTVGPAFDLDAEPHVLTDKDDFKVVPCRSCQRACVVTRFAAPAKVACHDHRERKVDVAAVREFDESKDEHVLTDKDETKRVPCRVCGRPCVVTRFATPSKVACLDHRDSAPRKTSKIVKDADGRHREQVETEFVSETDLQWQRWVIQEPMIEPDLTKDERADLEKHREQIAEKIAELSKVKRELRDLEAKAPSTKTDKAIAKLDGKAPELEADLARLRQERALIHRKATLRTLEDRGYELNGKDLEYGGEHVATLPDDYLQEVAA